MEYVIKKTYLGLALDEVLEDLGLEHMKKQISLSFNQAFMKNYAELQKQSKPIKIGGVEQNVKESPIGFGDTYSCYTVIASKINYKGDIEFLNRKFNASTCIEAFSQNKRVQKGSKGIQKKLHHRSIAAVMASKQNEARRLKKIKPIMQQDKEQSD